MRNTEGACCIVEWEIFGSSSSDLEFARFIRIALGSSTESANHLILLRELALLDETTFKSLDAQLAEVGRMLSGLEKRLRGED